MHDPWLIRHGRAEPPPERLALRAGPLALDFEDGDLRWLRVGGIEAIRRIYVTVRDRDWMTYPVRIRRIERELGARSFRIAYDAEHAGVDAKGGRIAFRSRIEISGGEDGTIAFAWDGECLEDLLSNRVGLCLLHPAACAGESCAIESIDGRRSEGRFPIPISPWQPFKELRAVITRPLPGVELEARLEGDTFEMEDQRNWSDGSFKTYSRPLGLPYPFPIRRGERFRQLLTLRLRGAAPEPVAQPRGVIGIAAAPASKLPRIGVGIDGTESAAIAARLRALAPSHLRVAIDLGDARWRKRWSAAMALARSLDRPLEAVVACPEDARVALAGLAAVSGGASVSSWLLVGSAARPTPSDLIAQARSALGEVSPGAAFGGAVLSHFTLMNRERPRVAGWDLYGFAVNPQVHAVDSSSIVDNLEGLAPIVASAAGLAGGAGIAVSPLTFAAPGASDPRQGSLFAAAWTVGALAGVAAARTVTCHAATGVIADDGSPQPAGHVLADVLEFSDAEVLRATCSDPLSTAVLALRRGSALRVLVANLRAEPIDVTLAGIAPARIRVLDERSAERARREPEAWRASWEPWRGSLRLLPYAVATVDG